MFRNYKVVDSYTSYFSKAVYIEIEIDKFDIDQHIVTRDTSDGYTDLFSVIKIDGKNYWGSDGELPLFEITQAIFFKDNKMFNIPIENMYNPWFVKPTTFARYLCNNNYIYKFGFSDGAGGYIAFYLETLNGLELIDIIMP